MERLRPARFLSWLLIAASSLLMPAPALPATSATLTVSSLSSAADGATVALSIRLGGATRPAALQWDLSFSTLEIVSITAAPGTVANDAGKSLVCRSRAAGSLTCVLMGLDSNVMQDGIAAVLTVKLTLNPLSTRTVGIANGRASTPAGVPIAVTATGGTVTTNNPGLSSITCAPATVTGSGASTCTMNLTRPAGSAGATAYVSDASTFVSVPGSVAIPAGAATASFTATVAAPTADASAAITAKLNAVPAAFSLQLYMLAVSSASCTPNQLSTATSAVCTLKLNRMAERAATVKLTSDTTLLTVPATIDVAAGTNQVSFRATAGTITLERLANVKATLVKTVSAPVILIASASCPCTLWTTSTVPTVTSDSTTVPVEVGMRFRTSSTGYILGLRFYKGSLNTGTHTGRLWTKGGTPLGSVQFTNETASGWQQAYFATPIAVNANTTYVISYQAPVGRVSNDANYFAASGFSKGPLRALKDGEDGVNGSVFFGTGFPSAGTGSRNYWVDVIFNSVASTSPTAVPVPSTTVYSANRDGATLLSALDPWARPDTMSCGPGQAAAGETVRCEITLGDAPQEGIITLESSNPDVRLPEQIRFRNGQKRVAFTAAVDTWSAGGASRISAEIDGRIFGDEIRISPSTVALTVPETVFARPGEYVSFTPEARDANGEPAAVSLVNPPEGASMQGAAFSWVPGSAQEGEHRLVFQASGPSGKTAKETTIIARSAPAIRPGAEELTCSPGAISTLRGEWLSSGPGEWIGTSATSLDAEGTGIRVNGTLVPVLFTSPARADFLCPDLPAGSRLDVSVWTPLGVSPPVQIVSQEATPRILGTVHSSGSETGRMVGARDYRNLGEPAQAHDIVWLLVTGLGKLPGHVAVDVGGITAPVLGIAPDRPGVSKIALRVPEGIAAGDAVPVRLELTTPGGGQFQARAVMAIE